MTAVEWLYSKMYENKGSISIEIFEQAKEMEKKQIIDAYEDGAYHNTFGNENYETSEDYYNQIFNKK
jgi:HEPN domain-containing protein